MGKTKTTPSHKRPSVEVTTKGLLAMLNFNMEKIRKGTRIRIFLQAIEIVLLFLILVRG